jgi:hypothetical protein
MKISLVFAPLGIMNLVEKNLSSSEKSIKISSMSGTPIPPKKFSSFCIRSSPYNQEPCSTWAICSENKEPAELAGSNINKK